MGVGYYAVAASGSFIPREVRTTLSGDFYGFVIEVLVFMVFFGSYVPGWLLLMMILPHGGVTWLGNLLALIIATLAARSAWLRSADPSHSALPIAGFGAAAS